MKSRDMIQGVRCLVLAGALVCLTGCSVSFGGFRLGGEKEFSFTCGEELPVQVSEEEPEASEEPAGSTIPAEEESASAADGKTETAAGPLEDGKVDLNTAGLEELMTLNGIGETRAKAILEYRAQNGSFTKEEDIMQVPGIKEGIYTKIQDQIIVR